MENSSGFSHAQTWQAGMNDDASRPARLRTGSTAPRFGAIRSQLLSHAVAVNTLSTHVADLCSTWSCCLHHKWLNTQSSRSSPVAQCCNIQLEIHTFWDVLGFHGSSLRKSTGHHGSTKIKGLEDPWCSSRPNIPPQGSHCDHAINTGVAAIHNLHEKGLRHCETAITSTLHTSLCKT